MFREGSSVSQLDSSPLFSPYFSLFSHRFLRLFWGPLTPVFEKSGASHESSRCQTHRFSPCSTAPYLFLHLIILNFFRMKERNEFSLFIGCTSVKYICAGEAPRLFRKVGKEPTFTRFFSWYKTIIIGIKSGSCFLGSLQFVSFPSREVK